MKKLTALIASFWLAACQTSVEPSAPKITEPEPKPQSAYSGTPIAGGVETLYIIPMKMPFHARMDTGAETSSIDASNLKPFERDGEKWIAFDIINRKNGEKHHFEKRLKRKVKIRRTEANEHRYVVQMNIKMGTELISAEFSLNDRGKFDYQVLIGRNIINGRYIIDPTLENTLN